MRTNGWLAALCGAAMLSGGAAFAASDVVTLYSVDGLQDGPASWFDSQFAAFSKATGIKVHYVEGGSAGIVERAAKESAKPQADVLVTLPPFMQQAAAAGLLEAYTPAGAEQIAGGRESPLYVPLVGNVMSFVYNATALREAPKSFADLLDPKFRGKLQYSTPGQTGDGTALMIQVLHAFGSKDAGFAYFRSLQDNNVGPSASAGRLTEAVDSGDLTVANGDLQMNMTQMADSPNIRVFWPTGPDGARTAVGVPYYIALVRGAPDSDNGRKLIDFLLGQQAQQAVSAMAMGLPVRRDVVPDDPTYGKLRALLQGVTVWTPDWAQVLKDLPSDAARWQRATGN